MTRKDGRRSPDDEPVDETSDESSREEEGLAAAETRVLDDRAEIDAAAETRVLDDRAVIEELDATAETRVLDAEAPTQLADEDRTHLVPRGSASAESQQDEALQLKATRVLDPAANVASASAPAAAAARDEGAPPPASAQAETRVIEEQDKTAPPPVDRAADAPAANRSPTPIDPAKGLAPGTVLFGEYEIVNVLGVGGMGEVYRAKHRRLEEHRAIKVMHAELSKKQGASEFFYREAKALLAVRHPAVVHCHDLLSDDEGRVYLIMEMIEGIPLSKKMNDGPLSPDDVAVLGARLAHGLSAAHRKGVIHRDISPDNIVLPKGRVQEAKIIDFGIAKILQEGEGTIVDGFKGKLSYASPEQLGFFGGKIDGRSDFYSLGLVLAAAALGRPMGMGTTVMEAVDARRGFQTLPDAIPMGLRSAIQPLLALDPKDRPQYVDRLFVVPGTSERSTDSSGGAGAIYRDAERSEAKSRTGLIAGIAAAVILLLGGGLYVGLRGEDSPSSSNAANVAVVPPVVVAPAAEEPKPSPAEPAARTPAVVVDEPVVVAKKPEPPKPRRISGADRIKIIGLLSNAKLALEENRLMSPANDNAYDRYRRVLEINPDDDRARAGLRDVAARYVTLAGRAADKGDLEEARSFLDRARRADSRHPGIASLEGRLGR